MGCGCGCSGGASRFNEPHGCEGGVEAARAAATSLRAFACACGSTGCGGSLYWADNIRMHVLDQALRDAEDELIGEILI